MQEQDEHANEQAPKEEDRLKDVPENNETLAEKAVKNVGIPEQAEDNDLIEKEWVDKAKKIVEHTSTNPYEQQKALNLVKSEYLKKRYNKDIKTSDG